MVGRQRLQCSNLDIVAPVVSFQRAILGLLVPVEYSHTLLFVDTKSSRVGKMERRRDTPSLAVERLWTISLMDEIVPFLVGREYQSKLHSIEEYKESGLFQGLNAYILKLPPTKNLRPMMAVVVEVC